MNRLPRRSFLEFAASAVPGSYLFGSNELDDTAAKPVLVSAGTDREGKVRASGVSSTSYKVLTAETAGAMFVMEQANSKKAALPVICM